MYLVELGAIEVEGRRVSRGEEPPVVWGGGGVGSRRD
jgi:hypothetical protein